MAVLGTRHAAEAYIQSFPPRMLAMALHASQVTQRQLSMQIFLLDMDGGSRAQASGQKWHEDLQWSRRLDEAWDLGAVKQVLQPTSSHQVHELV